MGSEILLREDSDGVCYLTLNRLDAYNALSMEMMQTLSAELDKITEDISVRVVVVRGGGKGFCAGHDLKQMLGEGQESYYQATFDTCSELMQRIVNLPVPVIAQVHGVATAAGCQLVASCDLAIAEDSTIFAVNGIDAGLFCSTPQVALSRNIPRKAALEMLMLGERIDAERALTLGLLNRVVTKETLAETAEGFADKAAMRSRTVIALGKQAFYKQVELSIEQAYKVMSETIVDNLMMPDAACGMEAFIEKKKPEWPSENNS